MVLKPSRTDRARSESADHAPSSVTGRTDKRAAQLEAAAAPFHALPVELLVDIFRYVSTSDAAEVAQVCRSWRAASSDVRIWRHLSFAKEQPDGPLQPSRRLASFGAKCGNTVTSVDFGNLASSDVQCLAAALSESAQSLRHITWTSDGDVVESLREVATLAKRCPKLESLELRTRSACQFQEVVRDAACLARIRRLSITACGSARASSGAGQQAYSISAPSLTYLNLRWSGGGGSNLVEIDAPRLCDLAINARLLPKLTSASLAKLSSLTLHINLGLSSYHKLGGVLQAINRTRRHQGSVRLAIGGELLEQVLQLLFFESFMWPALDEVEILVGENATDASCHGALISVIAARLAGARGASEEQYFQILRTATSRLAEASSRNAAIPQNSAGIPDDAFLHEARGVMAEASLYRLEPGVKPLCSTVQWKISLHRDTFETHFEFFEEQPNITVERW